MNREMSKSYDPGDRQTAQVKEDNEKFGKLSYGGMQYYEHAEFDESDTHVLERFDTSAGNPVKEILLKLNLPDHRSILTDSKMEVKVPDSS
ncbi:hypothetical protein Tco_1121830 [Tanacetum coccineum]|uniref:Uncharacterized protein n=1 Tax=Tanacetum coccineum TaxID=301880 RepID=A0ABQ5IYU9_9ASTR